MTVHKSAETIQGQKQFREIWYLSNQDFCYSVVTLASLNNNKRLDLGRNYFRVISWIPKYRFIVCRWLLSYTTFQLLFLSSSHYCANISVVSIAQRWDLSVFCLVNSPINAKVNPLNVKLVNYIFVPAWERKKIYRLIVQLSFTYLLTRRPVLSTDQAIPSCIYFRIS